MFSPLIFAAAVASAAPAPAWEPLACIYCDASEARSIGWSYEAALAAPHSSLGGWDGFIVPEALRGERFATQRQCLAALRRALPAVSHEVDDVGQITTREHRRDHVSETQTIPNVQTATTVFGCFQHAQPIG